MPQLQDPSCFLCNFRTPWDAARIQRNLDLCKRSRYLPQRLINIADIQAFDIDQYRIFEAFPAPLALDDTATNNKLSIQSEAVPSEIKFYVEFNVEHHDEEEGAAGNIFWAKTWAGTWNTSLNTKAEIRSQRLMNCSLIIVPPHRGGSTYALKNRKCTMQHRTKPPFRRAPTPEHQSEIMTFYLVDCAPFHTAIYTTVPRGRPLDTLGQW